MVKNADVKIVRSSCKNICQHTLNYDTSGNCFLNKDPRNTETAESFSTDKDENERADPSSTSTPNETQCAGQGLGGQKQSIIRHAKGFHIKDPTNHGPPNPAQAKIAEKCERIREELESRAREVKTDLIRAIRRAQTLSKERKKREKAREKIAVWVDGHVAKQRKIATRARDKKKNRAKPDGKRYMPALGNQSGSSVTFDSDSEDSILEVEWNPDRPQGPQGPQNPQNSKQNPDTMPRSARELQRSIRDRMRNQKPNEGNPVPKEGCTCPDGKCK